MNAAEPLTHIRLDPEGVAWVDDSNVKVTEIIADHLAYGHGPVEIQAQHPHLSLAQVYSAFAYYHGHAEKLKVELEARHRRVQRLRLQAGGGLSRAVLGRQLARR